jgi:hypothetical protein
VKTNNKTADFEEDSTQEAVSETFVAGKTCSGKTAHRWWKRKFF